MFSGIRNAPLRSKFDEFTGECNQKTQVAVEKLQFSSNFTEYQLPKNS